MKLVDLLCLNSCLILKVSFSITLGEFYNGERVYHIHHMPFYEKLKEDLILLKDLLKKLLLALDLLQEKSVIHADLKPDNILVKFDGEKIVSLKVIDFGSAFLHSQASSIRMSTPEYLSPECLTYLDSSSKIFTYNSLSL